MTFEKRHSYIRQFIKIRSQLGLHDSLLMDKITEALKTKDNDFFDNWKEDEKKDIDEGESKNNMFDLKQIKMTAFRKGKASRRYLKETW